MQIRIGWHSISIYSVDLDRSCPKMVLGIDPPYVIYLLHMSKVHTLDHKEVFDVSSHALRRHALSIIDNKQTNNQIKYPSPWHLKKVMNASAGMHTHESYPHDLVTRDGCMRTRRPTKQGSFVGVARTSAPCGLSLVIPPHEEHASS